MKYNRKNEMNLFLCDISIYDFLRSHTHTHTHIITILCKSSFKDFPYECIKEISRNQCSLISCLSANSVFQGWETGSGSRIGNDETLPPPPVLRYNTGFSLSGGERGRREFHDGTFAKSFEIDRRKRRAAGDKRGCLGESGDDVCSVS